MTNISRSSALKVLAVGSLLAVASGCGVSDGREEFAEGRNAFQAGDMKRADKQFRKALELNPSNVDAFLYQIQVKLRQGEIPAAKELLVKVEEIASAEQDVRLLGGQVAWHGRDYEKAIELFKAVAEDEDLSEAVRSQAWTGLGVAQATSGAHEVARVSYLKAIRLDRNNAAAYYNLGQLYRYDPFNFTVPARDQFERFVSLSGAEMSSPRVQRTQRQIIPGLTDAINRENASRAGAAGRSESACAAALSKAAAAEKKGKFKAARDAYQEALKADPLSFSAAIGLAKAEQKADSGANGLNRSLEAYRIACSLKPSAYKTLLEAGRLADRLNKPGAAMRIYSRVLAISPTSTEAVDGVIRSAEKSKADRAIIAAYRDYREMLKKPSAK